MSNPGPESPRALQDEPRAAKNPLHALTPPEPDDATLARVWQAVEPQLTLTPEQRVARRLDAVSLAEPDRATLNRVWGKTARQLRERRPRVIPVIWQSAASVTLVLFIVLLSVNALAASALPGDPLYGIKRAGEQARASLATNDTARAQFELSLADVRLDEARALVDRRAATALVAQALAEAKENLDAATPFVPPNEIGARLQRLDSFVEQIPEPYRNETQIFVPTATVAPTLPPATPLLATPQIPSATAVATLTRAPTSPSTAASTTVVPTSNPTVTPTGTGTALVDSETPTHAPTDVPPGVIPSSTIVPTTTPILSVPTSPGRGTAVPSTPGVPAPPIETPILPIQTLPIPTLPIPTLPLPTVQVPTFAAPTAQLPTLQIPTPVIPTLPLPTLPKPTLVIPTLPVPTLAIPTVAVPTVRVPTALLPTLPLPTQSKPTPKPTRTPRPTSGVPTLPLATLPLPTLVLPTVPLPTLPLLVMQEITR